MTRVRVFIVFVLAITAGGVFAFGTYNYVQKMPVKTVAMPTRPVIVASSNLDIAAEISKDDVRVIDWPTSAVPANAFSDPQEVIGRGIIMPMIQNEPFLPLKLSSKDGGGGLPPPRSNATPKRASRWLSASSRCSSIRAKPRS